KRPWPEHLTRLSSRTKAWLESQRQGMISWVVSPIHTTLGVQALRGCPMQDPSPSQCRRRRIPLRVSLRVFMALVVVLGVVLARVVHRAQVQRKAVVAIERARGIVCYDWEWKNGQGIAGGAPWAPRWLVDRIGADYFGSVTLVTVLFSES